MLIIQKIKPLSVNDAWQGKRYKSTKYKNYEEELLYKLPSIELPEPPYQITFTFGFSNVASDIDNPVKPLLDVMGKKYGFNDKNVYKLIVDKTIVKKGDDFFRVEVTTLNNYDSN